MDDQRIDTHDAERVPLAQRQASDAPSRFEHEKEAALERLWAQVAALIGRDLSMAEITALSNSPEALDQVRFHIDTALKKVARWNLPKG